MATLSETTITEDFSNSSKLLFPITPWQIITDSGKTKLISNTIGNSATTTVTFTVNCSHIEFDYRVSSENNYDYFYIFIDNIQKVKVSGTSITGSTTFSTDLTNGNHTIKFQYSKDGSSTAGLDRAEVWNIRYTIVPGTPKFLFADGTNVKYVPSSVTDLSTVTSLTTAGTYPMSDNTYFTSYGMPIATINYIIKNKMSLFTNTPKVLLYTDWLPTCITPNYKIMESSNPYAQIGEMKNDITFDVSTGISNISKCAFNAKVDSGALLKFVFSKDGGVTWLTFDGTNWISCEKSVSAITTSGMTIDVCSSLTEEQLILISDTRKIRVAWVMKRVGSTNALISSIGFKFN